MVMTGAGILAALTGAGVLGAVGVAICTGLAPVITGIQRSRMADDAGRTRLAAAVERHRGAAARALALQLTVDRLEAVLGSLREAVVVVDSQHEIVLSNPVARSVLCDRSRTPVGLAIGDVLAPGLGAIASQLLAELEADPDSERPARRSGVGHDGQVLDVTAVKVRSRESGQGFATAFLFVDASSAHELSRLKDRFLSSMSHELRTPLTNICAYAEILRNITPREVGEWPAFVRIIHEEGLQLSRLVDGLFDYSRLESGDTEFDRIEIDGDELATVLVGRARARADEARIELLCERGQGLPRIMFDRSRFEQVCDQLIDNAIKFTPADGRVRIAVTARDGDLQLCVEDSGPGVARVDRSRVFEEFSQLSDPLTDKPAGAGLGLAISHAIITLLGGRIWCEESDLGGAAFIVLVPGIDAESTRSAARRLPLKARQSALAPSQPVG